LQPRILTFYYLRRLCQLLVSFLSNSRSHDERAGGMLAPTPVPIRVRNIAVANADEQGDVYLKIIEEVVEASKNDFEESGVGQGTLNGLQQVSNNIPACLFLFLAGRLSALERQAASIAGQPRRLMRSHGLAAATGGIALRRPLAQGGCFSNRRSSHQRAQADKAGAQGSKAPGCALLLHRRLKAISLPHSPTHSVTLNHLQLV
jgi:hypothetical protein